jgi:hypothetical protein
MAQQFPVEGFLLFLYRIMPMRFAPGRHSLEAAPESLAHRSNMYRKLPMPAAFAEMRESKKVESGRLPPSRPFRFRQSLPPERNQSSLIRMERQSVPCKSLSQHIQHPLRIFPILKAQNEIIAITNLVGLALQTGLHRLLEP